ncbi:SusD/RagB family nutrient-binding outer membrane lipoprotein [Chryseosolibacter indicus]|uniref:SusD/RagB family nutrient-binding outer membrane lipoprotein n=1 Tax=Chryseosolibacter indicus TaxID=2782351 RepID=A0ABS5VS44_9BACT|nr:SusD/RagB family nutrient-binding outer membrane lipoprotein [Chryseosolibacter indicus]MBT1704262.1 SusD/RagB family nutrient-binding outer membrane lipoprotein [Chryseosolibacter indicus]
MKRFFKNILIVSSCISVLVSCSDFLDVNDDPTRLKTASISQTLVAAETSLAFNMGADIFIYSSIFSQQAAGQGVTAAQTREYDKYILSNSDVNGTWSNFYSVCLADLNYLKQNSQGNPQHAGIANVLQAFAFGILTDVWGNVPYKDALEGVSNVQPAFDDSKEIYDSLFVLIDEGIAKMKQTNAIKIGAEDLIYGGDMTKWEKFANTLKLRLALHYAKVDGGNLLKSVINAGGPFMESNNDNFQMAFENVTNRQNPIHQFELQRADYYAPSDFIIKFMQGKTDPRLTMYFTPFPYSATTPASPYTAYRGTIPGDATSVPYSRIHTYLRGSVTADNGTRAGNGGLNSTSLTYTGAAPIRMLTYAEYNFIVAEAMLVYGASAPVNKDNRTTKEDFFAAGIEASLANAGITGGAASTYVSAQTSTALSLQKIIEEKYVANFGVGVEPWNDWKRTGFPLLSVSPAAAAAGNNTIPRSLVYPLSEQQANLNNVPQRASMVVKGVFWDN